MYNKRKFNKINDKKVLHKIKKQWVTISLALLMMIGGGAIATHVSANADTANNDQPLTSVKDPIRHVVKSNSGVPVRHAATPNLAKRNVYTSVSSASSRSQQSSVQISQSSVEDKYNTDNNNLNNVINGSYGKINWTPSMMDAYTALINASNDDSKETSAFNVDSILSTASNSATFSNVSTAASTDDVIVNHELSAFASNYPIVESHLAHGPLVESYEMASISASANMTILDELANSAQEDLKPFASLSNAYQSDNDEINDDQHFANPIGGVGDLSNDVIKADIHGLDTIMSYQNDMSNIGSKASVAYGKLPASQRSADDASFASSANAFSSTYTSASISASKAVVDGSESAAHLTNAQLQLAAYSAIDSYGIREYGMPDVLAQKIRKDAMTNKSNESTSSSESTSNEVKSAAAQASTSSIINSYLATLSGDSKTSAMNVIGSMNTISRANSDKSSSFVNSINSYVNSLYASDKQSAASYSSSCSRLDASYAVSEYDKSTGSYGTMTSALQSTVVSDFNNRLLANNAISNDYDTDDASILRNYLLTRGVNRYYSSIKNSVAAQNPALFTPNNTNSAISNKVSNSAASSSSTSTGASGKASSSATSSEQSSNNTNSTPFISLNIPTAPVASSVSANPMSAVTPLQNTTSTSSSSNSSMAVSSAEPQTNLATGAETIITKPAVNKYHNTRVVRNHRAKHGSLYLLGTDFKGLSKRNRLVTTIRGLRAYKRSRKDRYVPVKDIKSNTKLAVKRVIKFGKITRLQLTNGLLVTANKHFVKVSKIAKRSHKRVARPSRYVRALRKSNYILRHGRRHARRSVYRLAKQFRDTGYAEKKVYHKFARKHTYRNRKAYRKVRANLDRLVNALLK